MSLWQWISVVDILLQIWRINMPRYDDKYDSSIHALEALGGMGKGTIERAEARGQADLVKSADFPRKMMGVCKEQVAAGTGIVFGENVNDLFVSVTLPDGWKLVATDHNMWSDLVDNKGRKRASVFYKAAVYDRDAFARFNKYYNVKNTYHNAAGVPQYTKDGAGLNKAFSGEALITVTLEDADGGVLRSMGPFKMGREPDDAGVVMWKDHLVQFPDSDNPFAYWS
jgi:hypothetical protein